MTSKVLFTPVLLPAHITVHESSFMNSPFMIPKAPLDIILLSAHSTLGESCFMYSPYMKYMAPFTSAVLPANITFIPHEQLHTVSKALSISVILLADITVAKSFSMISSASITDPRFFFSRTTSEEEHSHGITNILY